MDLNPELLSAIDRLCVGLVVQCMFQCRVHNLNLRYFATPRNCYSGGGGGGLPACADSHYAAQPLCAATVLCLLLLFSLSPFLCSPHHGICCKVWPCMTMVVTLQLAFHSLFKRGVGT